MNNESQENLNTNEQVTSVPAEEPVPQQTPTHVIEPVPVTTTAPVIETPSVSLQPNIEVAPVEEPQLYQKTDFQPQVTEQAMGQTILASDNQNSTIAQDSQPMTAPMQDGNKKRKNMYLWIVMVLAVLALAAGVFYYFNNTEKGFTAVLKSALSQETKTFASFFEGHKEMWEEIDFTSGKVAVKGTLSFDGMFLEELFLEELKESQIQYELGIDAQNEKMLISGSALEAGQTIVDGKLYYAKDTVYLKSDTMLVNTLYTIVEEGQNIGNQYYELLEQIMQYKDTMRQVKPVVTKIKQVLVDSLDEAEVEQTKTKLTIGNKKVDARKMEYVLDKDSLHKLVSKIAEEILADNALLTDIADLTDSEVADIKLYLELLQDKETYEDFEGEYAINIYTTGFKQEFVKAEIIIDDVTLYYTREDESNAILGITSKYQNAKITIKTEKDSLIMNLEVEDEELFNVSVTKETDEKTVIKLEMIEDESTTSLTVSLITQKINAGVKGKIELNLSVDEQQSIISVTLDYEVTTGKELETFDTTNAVDELTEQDEIKFEEGLGRLKQSSIGSVIEEIIMEYFVNDFTGNDDMIDWSEEDYDYNWDEDFDYDWREDFDLDI